MALPVPNLDDRRFQDLVDDAKRLVQQRCPEWSDHNVSDPGVTLIELFAWMTDQVVYRLNRVPDRNYVKFLELIGVSLYPPTAARAPDDVLAVGAAARRRHDPAGTQVATVRTDTDEAIVFSDGRGPADHPVRAGRAGLDDRRQDAARPHGRPREGHRGLLLPEDAVARRRAVHRPVRGGPVERGPAAVQRRHRRRRRRPDQPAARLGGVDGRRLGAVRARLRLHRRPQPRRRRRHPRPARPRGVADREAAGGLAAGAGDGAGRGPARLQRLAQHQGPRGDHDRRHRRRRATPSSSPTRRSGSPRACRGSASCSSAGRWCPATSRRRSRSAGDEGWDEWTYVPRLRRQRPGRQALHRSTSSTGEVRLGPAVRLADGALRRYGAVPAEGRPPPAARSTATGGGRTGNVVGAGDQRAQVVDPVRVARREPAPGPRRRRRRGHRERQDPRADPAARPRPRRDRPRTTSSSPARPRRRSRACARVAAGDGTDAGVGPASSIVPSAVSERGRLRFDQLVPNPDTLQKITDRLEESRVIGTRAIVEPPVYRGITVVAQAQGAPARQPDPAPGGRAARAVRVLPPDHRRPRRHRLAVRPPGQRGRDLLGAAGDPRDRAGRGCAAVRRRPGDRPARPADPAPRARDRTRSCSATSTRSWSRAPDARLRPRARDAAPAGAGAPGPVPGRRLRPADARRARRRRWRRCSAPSTTSTRTSTRSSRPTTSSPGSPAGSGSRWTTTGTRQRRRAIVARAVELYRLRGTAAGLAGQVEIQTGGTVEIVENGATGWSVDPGGELPGSAEPLVVVRVTVPDPKAIDTQRLDRSSPRPSPPTSCTGSRSSRAPRRLDVRPVIAASLSGLLRASDAHASGSRLPSAAWHARIRVIATASVRRTHHHDINSAGSSPISHQTRASHARSCPS